MRHAVFLAPHGEFADPRLVVELAVVAEASGWDAIYLWDHMARPAGVRPEVSDAAVCLAGIASATSRLRLGPMVTPLARRRPQKVARETVALDLLSNGRLTLGVGLGVDTAGELDRFGEEADDRRRGALLDEALALLLELWSGEEVHHEGDHFRARDVAFRPVPLQRPRIPVWAAARGAGTARTIERAAGLDGVFPVHTSRTELADLVGAIERRRGTLADFDVAWTPDGPHDAGELERLGVTWLVRSIPESTTVAAALRDVAAGPTT